MDSRLRTLGKRLLSKVIPDSRRARYLTSLPKLETWRHERAAGRPTFPDRYALYSFLNNSILRNGPIAYMEFGVFKGRTLRHWSTLNTHPDSRFWGFDTFTGLPDTWDTFTGGLQKGKFDLHGHMPSFTDSRVALVKGLFQDSLDAFLRSDPIAGTPVIHIDCDLYSSTLYVLTRCTDFLGPGTLLVFDEFSSMLHEFRALEDYCDAYRKEYEVLGSTLASDNYYSQVAIRLLQ